MLLVGAGLLIRGLVRVLDVNLEFQPERAAALRIDPGAKYAIVAQRNAYYDEALRRVRSIAGVGGTGVTDALPLGGNRSWGAMAKGRPYARENPPPDAFVRVVSDGYFRAMGITFRAGRDFTERDRDSMALVIIVNETLARTLWPGENPIGRTMTADTERLVIGVVSDVRHLALEEASGCEMYLPIRQTDDYSSVDLVVRTRLPPAALASAVRTALAPLDPDVPANEFRTLQQLVDRAVSPRRFVVFLLGAFSLFAVLLASLGIYARGFVRGGAAHAGDRHPDGARRVRARRAGGRDPADPPAGGRGHRARPRCVVDVRVRAPGAALRCGHHGSPDVRRDGGDPHGCCRNRGLSAGAPCFQDRPVGGPTNGLTRPSAVQTRGHRRRARPHSG